MGEDMQSIGGVVGQWLKVGICHLLDVDLNGSQRNIDFRACGPAGVCPGGDQEIELPDLARLESRHRVQVGGR
jgi:hypothetical protein